MNEVWFLMSLFPGTSVSLPWQPTVPLFLRQNLDDFWLDDFWIVLLDCEVTLENSNAIRIALHPCLTAKSHWKMLAIRMALHPTLPLMERSRLQTAHY